MNQIARNVAVEEVALWRFAVDMQQRRIVADYEALDDLLAANAATADFRLYAVALRNLLRAVEFAIEVFPEHSTQLGLAERRFSKQVPDASVVRDILEHFDAYAKGTGHLIAASRYPDRGFPPAMSFRFTPGGAKVYIALYRYSETCADFIVAREVCVDTAVATAAAVQMAGDALTLIA